MDAKPSMCEFLNDAQQSFDQACVAFSQNNNMSEIANEIGLPANVLRNMLNPEQPRLLTPPILAAITKSSQDYTIVNTLNRYLEMVTAPISVNASDSTKQTFLKRVLENSLTAGDLSRMALDHGDKTRLSNSARNRIIDKAQAGISNLVLLISDLENRTSGMSPFLSMGVDFIANGAPVPGLA
ncbi:MULTISPECIES: phage regulatory CII family protein [unclassified Vibrio]|uniref:phage regulatory CII family protein n=1 Tax=unclassified Vibrio TaxID=2614977 RepID=UPI001361A1FA|nr:MULTISPECIES: phage regulatory CII family protein [unclassified Vibrio]NAW58741.1 transcriptional regulator [Vibrio sp. V36_P2S2PM302]NAX27174.1 transcriptional regulator [Vibrio sp. V38_P2S17PM301]NAX31727.1 transcriptional regulator [Vibrio sp. V37_P2S8PM304]